MDRRKRPASSGPFPLSVFQNSLCEFNCQHPPASKEIAVLDIWVFKKRLLCFLDHFFQPFFPYQIFHSLACGFLAIQIKICSHVHFLPVVLFSEGFFLSVVHMLPLNAYIIQSIQHHKSTKELRRDSSVLWCSEDFLLSEIYHAQGTAHPFIIPVLKGILPLMPDFPIQCFPVQGKTPYQLSPHAVRAVPSVPAVPFLTGIPG